MNDLPTPEQPLRIGTRASPLAMAQANMAAAALIASHGLDPEALVVVPMSKKVSGFVQSPLGDFVFEGVDIAE